MNATARQDAREKREFLALFVKLDDAGKQAVLNFISFLALCGHVERREWKLALECWPRAIPGFFEWVWSEVRYPRSVYP
jgi:hypothetical protein